MFLEQVFYTFSPYVFSGKRIYNFCFGSTEPVAYLNLYVIFDRNTYTIYGQPSLNNISNTDIVSLSKPLASNIEIGNTVQITVSNDNIKGMSSFINVSLKITDKPVVELSSNDSFDAIKYLEEAVDPLIQEAKLFTLRNIALVEILSKLNLLKKTNSALDEKKATLALVQDFFSQKSLLASYAKIDSSLLQDFFTRNRLQAKEGNVCQFFADIVVLSEHLFNSDIVLEKIPYQVSDTIMLKWLKTKDDSYITRLKVCSENVEITKQIELNLATCETKEKVKEIIRILSSFTYVSEITLTNSEGETKHISIEKIYTPSCFQFDSSSCSQNKGLHGTEGENVIFSVSYGTACDYFVGVMVVHNNSEYGIERKVVYGETPIKTWATYWGDAEVAFNSGTVNTDYKLTVDIKGV